MDIKKETSMEVLGSEKQYNKSKTLIIYNLQTAIKFKLSLIGCDYKLTEYVSIYKIYIL